MSRASFAKYWKTVIEGGRAVGKPADGSWKGAHDNNCYGEWYDPTRDVYPEVGMGEIKEVGCGLSGGPQNQVDCPPGFSSAGAGGACDYDSLASTTGYSWNCNCWYAHCPVSGRKLKCKRTRWTGDPLQCCLTKKRLLGLDSGTCPPEAQDPNSDYCRSAMESYCRQRSNFFKDECKAFVGDLQSTTRDTIANAVCPLVKTNGTAAEKAWCKCYNIEVPSNLKGNKVMEGIFRCLDPTCQGPQALKPYSLDCPTSLVNCEQEDIKTNLLQSGIDQQTIENNCGNISISGESGPSGPSGESGPSGPSSPSGAGGLSKGAIFGIAGAAGVLVLIIIIIIIVAATRRNQPVIPQQMYY